MRFAVPSNEEVKPMKVTHGCARQSMQSECSTIRIPVKRARPPERIKSFPDEFLFF